MNFSSRCCLSPFLWTVYHQNTSSVSPSCFDKVKSEGSLCLVLAIPSCKTPKTIPTSSIFGPSSSDPVKPSPQVSLRARELICTRTLTTPIDLPPMERSSRMIQCHNTIHISLKQSRRQRSREQSLNHFRSLFKFLLFIPLTSNSARGSSEFDERERANERRYGNKSPIIERSKG